jgi:alkane 1-monooxygenase
MKWYAYLLPLSFYITALISFHAEGLLSYATLLLAFVIVGLLELFIPPATANTDNEEQQKANPVFRWIQILFVFLQWATLIYFLYVCKHQTVSIATVVGRITSMGLLCGVYGINVAHELGHHKSKTDQFFAKACLLTSLYMHFFIEHNKGHHRHVSTPYDPASARLNESVYAFYLRSILGSYRSAWQIENKEMLNKYGYRMNLKNKMIQFHLIEISLLTGIFFYAGLTVLIFFISPALIGILLLESVNYIQHYGLSRKKTEKGSYERTQIWHSWDCHHPLGRMILFELSRHSDHHYLASRPYQILRYHDDAPSLPTGYPGSIFLALIPPLWFRIMNRKIQAMDLTNK